MEGVWRVSGGCVYVGVEGVCRCGGRVEGVWKVCVGVEGACRCGG